MNKRILSVFVLCAFYHSVQAQEGKGGISDTMMQQIKQTYQETSADKAIRNAIGSNDIRKLALNQDNLKTGYDMVVIARQTAKGQNYHTIESAFLHLIDLHHLKKS